MLDDSLTEYQGVLYNEIRVIGREVKLYHLIVSWFSFKLRSLWKWVANLYMTKGKSVLNSDKLQLMDYKFYADKYNKLKNSKNMNVKMSSFCESENIDLKEFNRYFIKYCQSKK